MDPFEELKHEHETILRASAVMRALSARASSGDAALEDELTLLRSFLDGFVHGCHHRKEEDALFPKMAARSEQIAQGPVRVLTSDHQAGRVLMKQISHAQAARDGVALAKALSTYATLLERHIARENEIIFPLAAAVVSQAELVAMADEFKAIEAELDGHGLHQRMEQTVARLESLASA